MIKNLFLFHGLGSESSQMQQLGKILLEQARVSAEIIPVQGKFDFGEPGNPCWGWFEPPDDLERDFEVAEPPAFGGIEESIARIHSAIDAVRASGVDSRHIHLVGHSQGGAIALSACLTYAQPLGSVSTVAGYLALTPQLRAQASGTPYFLHHCRNDDNVSFKWAGYAQARIEKIGERCEIVEYPESPYPHSVQPSQITSIANLLQSLS